MEGHELCNACFLYVRRTGEPIMLPAWEPLRKSTRGRPRKYIPPTRDATDDRPPAWQ